MNAIVTEPGRDGEGIVEALTTQLKSYTGTKGLPPEDVTVIIVQRHKDVVPASSSHRAIRSGSRALKTADFGVD